MEFLTIDLKRQEFHMESLTIDLKRQEFHIEILTIDLGRQEFHIERPLQNLLSLNSHLYTLRRINIFDQKMPLEVIFE